MAIGEPLPPADPVELPPSTRRLQAVVDAYQSVAWRPPSGSGRATATVGTEAVEGRAIVAVDPIDALLRLEPGDVLVAATTTAPYNTVFPMAAAVAVEHGGLASHATILARELGITAVIGVPGLMERVRDGDQVRVDPIAGTITVLDPAT
jgi:pyruvate,water dikinase